MHIAFPLSLSLSGFLFLNLPLWLELTFSLYLLSKCFETTEGGGFAKITPIKEKIALVAGGAVSSMLRERAVICSVMKCSKCCLIRKGH